MSPSPLLCRFVESKLMNDRLRGCCPKAHERTKHKGQGILASEVPLLDYPGPIGVDNGGSWLECLLQTK